MRIPPAIATLLAALLVTAPPAFARAGTLDHGFGTSGVFSAQLGQGGSPGSDFAAIAPVSGGDAIAVGAATDTAGHSEAIIARLTHSGALDPSFGSAGVVTLPTSIGLNALAIAPDGKLVVAGDTNTGALIARLNSNGTLDTTFGTGGMVTDAPPNSFDSLSATRLAIGSDDSIVVVLSLAGAGGREAEIQRLTSTGTADGSFGQSGIVRLDFSFEHPPITDLPGIALRLNGRIVLGGSSTGQNIDRAPDPVVTRLKTDGSTDPHFGKNGVFWPLGIGGEGSISDLALRSNGKILITGGLLRKGEAFVARLTKNGKLDNRFGNKGFVKLQAGKGSSPDSESDTIALTPDGRILIAGTASTKSGGRQAFAARLTSDGHRDKKFGSHGIERIGDPLANAQASLVDLALSGRKRALLVDDFPVGFRPTATVWVAAIKLA